jgi:NAD(P)-dependent dehydrogenase (short-subunit alcohol dehydrogenase family)
MKNLFPVAGKTALVTGGSRGVGLMIARDYVENGAKVYISSRKADVCDAVAAELSEHGECISLPADISDMAGVAIYLASRAGAYVTGVVIPVDGGILISGNR